MDQDYIGISSVTYALRGQQLLNEHGIRCYMGRNEKIKTARGCGYRLTIPGADIRKAYQILIDNNVKVIGMFRGNGDAIS